MRCVRRLGLLVLPALVLSSAGCARLLGSYDIAPSGLPSSEDRLRRLLVGQQAPAALERLQRNAPDDAMLHTLHYGVLAYHAGDYAESARVLDIAAHIADERMTKSLSRAALSLVSNDLILDYEPGRTERLMIPYYGALARLRLGDTDGAAVEARRLSLLLQQYDDQKIEIDRALRATLRYVAGAVFEAAGEYADADVAYRNAAALDSAYALPDDASTRERGTVVIILEQGFVTHRVEQDLNVMLLPEEIEALTNGSGESRAAVTAFVAGRVIEHALMGSSPDRRYSAHRGTLFVPAPEKSVVPRTRMRTVCTEVPADSASAGGARRVARRECVEREEEIRGAPYLWRMAWPVLQTPPRLAPARVALADASHAFRGADISRGVSADFERERTSILARTLARNITKLALSKGAERRVEDGNEAAGRLLGIIGNIGSALTERADTRSWHLLPAGVSVVRLQLEPGVHELSVELDAPGGSRPLGLGPLTVTAGAVTILPARAW
jgi:hypothetical protein